MALLNTNMEDQRALTTQQSSRKSIRASICILVVDNDTAYLETIEAMLREFEYKVVAVNCASEALALLSERQGEFGIILTNLHMPEMDGITLLERVEIEFKIPVVIMSANDDVEVILRCLESGAAFYLTKPLTARNLKNLWQYIYAKKNNKRIAEQIVNDSESVTPEKSSKEDTECASTVNESSWRKESRKKSSRKKDQNKGGNNEDNATQKKLQVLQNDELHNKFLDAIAQTGPQGLCLGHKFDEWNWLSALSFSKIQNTYLP